MSNEFIRINTAFKPPVEVAERVAKISGDIGRKAETYFVIDDENYFPHITIYSPEYPTHNLEKVLKTAESIAKDFSAPNFIFQKIGTGQGFITLDFDYSDEIKKIHEATVKKLNPLRENHVREKYTESYMMKFSEEKRKNIRKYGYPNSMAFYRPHMTLARLKNEEFAEKIAQSIEWPVREFKAEKLAAYEMGLHGTCVRLVKEFNFGKR